MGNNLKMSHFHFDCSVCTFVQNAKSINNEKTKRLHKIEGFNCKVLFNKKNNSFKIESKNKVLESLSNQLNRGDYLNLMKFFSSKDNQCVILYGVYICDRNHLKLNKKVVLRYNSLMIFDVIKSGKAIGYDVYKNWLDQYSLSYFKQSSISNEDMNTDLSSNNDTESSNNNINNNSNNNDSE